jgi:hypothetical protein
MPCCGFATDEKAVIPTPTSAILWPENEPWVALVPRWATWPYKILCEPPLAPQILQLATGAVLPYKWHIAAISNLDAEEKSAFVDIWR